MSITKLKENRELSGKHRTRKWGDGKLNGAGKSILWATGLPFHSHVLIFYDPIRVTRLQLPLIPLFGYEEVEC